MVMNVVMTVGVVVLLLAVGLVGKWWREAAQRNAYLLDEREKERIRLEHERRMKQLTWEQEHPTEVRRREIMRRREKARNVVRDMLLREVAHGSSATVHRAALELEEKEREWAKEDLEDI